MLRCLADPLRTGGSTVVRILNIWKHEADFLYTEGAQLLVIIRPKSPFRLCASIYRNPDDFLSIKVIQIVCGSLTSYVTASLLLRRETDTK